MKRNSFNKHRIISLLKTGVLFFLLLILLTACNPQPEAPLLLERAEAMMESQPDSAMLLLDSIAQPKKSLKQRQYMDYWIANVQAKYKNYRDIHEDIEIFEALRYYKKKKDHPERFALANYLGGCVLREAGNHKEAIPYFLQSIETAESAGLYLQQGLSAENLGFIYSDILLPEQAILYYKQALAAYNKVPNSELKQLNATDKLGFNMLIKEQTELALVYYEESKKIAFALNDSSRIGTSLINIAQLYNSTNAYAQAIPILKEAANYLSDNLASKIDLHFAKAYIELGQYKHAEYYIQKLKSDIEQNEVDLYYKSAVLTVLSQYEKLRGNYAQALAFNESRLQIHVEIFEANQGTAAIEAEKKYNYSLKEAEAEKAELKHRNNRTVFILLITLLVVFGFFLRKRHLQLLTEKADKLRSEKAQQKLVNRELEFRLQQYNFSVELYKTLLSHSRELHKSLFDIAEKAWFKERSVEYEKIISLLKRMEETAITNMAVIAREFLEEQLSIAGELVDRCSDSDLLLLHRLYIKEPRKDTAVLFNIKPHTLTQRIARLKQKVEPLLNEEQYRSFFHQPKF